MGLRLCKYYEHPKTCTYKDSCAEQALFDKKHCQSKLYYSMWLEQENKSLRNELKKENDTAFGTITRLYSVMGKMSERIERYEWALNRILAITTAHCDACEEFEPSKKNPKNCRRCQQKIMLDIINQAKGVH